MLPLRLVRPQLNPIIVRELRVLMRGVRPYAILTAFLVVLTLVGYGVVQLMLRQARMGSVVLSAQVGQALFSGLALSTTLLVVFLAPATTSGTISGEREQLTYDMLLATPLRPARILRGKLIAALSYIFLLIFATLPIFSVVLTFGGVAPTAMLKSLLLLLITTITFGTVGLFCSALLRRTARATVIGYAAILLLVGGSSVAGSLWGNFSTPPGQPPPPPLMYLNPFSALISITTVTPGSMGGPFFGGIGDVFGSLPLLYLLSPGVIYYGPAGPVTVPIYRATLLFYPLLTLLLYWLCIHLVLPRQRWRPTWSDLGFLVVLVALLMLIWSLRSWWYVLPPPMP